MSSDFKEAFLKAGVVTKERINCQEHEEKQLIENEKKKQADNKQKQQLECDNKYNEYLVKIQPFESRWQNTNSKNFIKHLLNAYLPFDKGQIVFDWALINDRTRRCCICNRELISKIETLEKIPEMTDMFINVLEKEIKEKGLEVGLASTTQDAKQQVFGNKLFGVFSRDSTKLFCGKCYSIFTEWVQNKMFTDTIFANYITSIRLHQNVASRSH